MKPPTFHQTSAKTVMNKVDTPAMPFQWSLNPYRGCTHGCSFCYARNTHTFMGMSADDSFRTQIFVKRNAAEALERQLERMAKRHQYNLTALAREIGLLAIGTATDPYQPVEGKSKITRKCLEVLAQFRVPVTITTRSPLILRDLDLFEKLDLRSVNISIHTLDKRIWRSLEPATPSPLKRLETIRTLVQNHVNTGALLAPVIPYLTDSDAALEQVIIAVKEHRGQFVSPSVLRLSPDVKTWFFGVIREQYPAVYSRIRPLYKGTYAPETYTRPLLRRARIIMERHGFHNYGQAESKQTPTVEECEYLEGKSVQLALPI